MGGNAGAIHQSQFDYEIWRTLTMWANKNWVWVIVLTVD